MDLGCIRSISFACNLQLESGKAGVREVEESVFICLGRVNDLRFWRTMPQDDFRGRLFVDVGNVFESDPTV